MFSFNVVTWIVLLALGAFLASRGGTALRFGGPTLVLRRFELSPSSSGPVLFRIFGRVSGLTSFALTTVGLDDEVELSATTQELTLRSASLYGRTQQTVPLRNLASTRCGYTKPVGFLICGSLCAAIGLFLATRSSAVGAVLGLLIGAACLAAYYLQKRTSIFVETSGGHPVGVSFKASVIENVGLSMEQAEAAIALLNQCAFEQTGGYRR